MGTAIAIEKPQNLALHQEAILPLVLGGLVMSLTFCFCCARFNDPDTWLHLKMGEEIWQTHALPQADHWSFTVNGRSRIDHEWIPQLSMYFMYRVAGYQGLQLWLCTFASVIVGLV